MTRSPRSVMIVTGLVLSAALTACGVSVPNHPISSSPIRTSPPSTSAAPSSSPSSSPGPQVLLDESFDTPQLDTSVWNTCYWWDDQGCTIVTNHELEWYRPEGVRVANGAAQLIAEPVEQRAPDGTRYPFRSGMISTGPATENARAKLAFTYGTVEARLKVPDGKGLWSALWLLPADTSSRPEIDVLEILGNDPTSSIMHLHPADRKAASPGKTVRLPGVDFSSGFHDFRLDWRPGVLIWSIDGKPVWRLTGRQVPDTPMYLIANLAVGGDYPGDPSARTVFPARLAIDHLKITSAAS